LRFLLGLLLVAEGFLSGLGTLQDLPTAIAARDVQTAAIIFARAVTGVGLFAGGWTLLKSAPPAAAIATVALLTSAVLRVLELGFALGPTDLAPNLHWPVTLAYATYALVGVTLLRLRR
jgi:hypothetical protein